METVNLTAYQQFLKTVCENDNKLMEEFIDMFVSDTAEHIEKMYQSIAQEQRNNLQYAAHSLKSSSAQLGAKRLSALCSELEHAIRNHSLADTADIIASIQAEYEQVKATLLKLLSGD